MGARTVDSSLRNEGDFYPTPHWVTRSILHVLPKKDFLDPACGEGDILLAGINHGVGRGFELNITRAAIGRERGFKVETRDALSSHTWSVKGGLVIMNPPYIKGLDFAFAQRAVVEVGPKGTVAALLNLAFMSSKSRAPFHRTHKSDVHVFSSRIDFTKSGVGAKLEHAWFVWGPGFGGRWTIIDF